MGHASKHQKPPSVSRSGNLCFGVRPPLSRSEAVRVSARERLRAPLALGLPLPSDTGLRRGCGLPAREERDDGCASGPAAAQQPTPPRACRPSEGAASLRFGARAQGARRFKRTPNLPTKNLSTKNR